MPGRPHRVFIVYGGQDSAAAARIAEDLRELGLATFADFGVFFDRQKIHQGDLWADTMARELSNSTAAVVLLSPALFRSRWASRELTALIRRREADPAFVLLPVMLEPTEPPGFMKGLVYIDAHRKEPRVVARVIVDALAGRPLAEPHFRPTGPAEYHERLQSIRQAAARDEDIEDVLNDEAH
jgi:hypothetical protein